MMIGIEQKHRADENELRDHHDDAIDALQAKFDFMVQKHEDVEDELVEEATGAK